MSIHKALSELAPNACWCMDGAQTYDNLQWNSDDIEKPSEAQVNAKIAEIEAAFPLKFLRRERDAMLKESDWTQTPDVPESIQTAWKTYRQALRDVPANTSDPANPTWPTKPS